MTALAAPKATRAEDPAAPRRRAVMRLVGLSLAIACALVRAAAAFEPFPHWEADPTILDTPITALSPSASLSLDIITLLACALALLGVQDYRPRSAWLTLLALAAGAGAIAYHGLIHAGGSLDDLRIGSTWLAAFVTGATAHQVCRHEQLRRIALGASFGLIAMLAFKGMGQVLYEHPQTLQMYQQNREQFLGAQGWAPDSPSALAFERRLLQSEASGWFGLSNVYASVAACTSVGLVGLAAGILAIKRGTPNGAAAHPLPTWIPICVALGALLALASLYLAGSKGGFTGAALGLGVLLVFTIAKRRAPRWASARLASAASFTVVALSLLAVVVRGLIGERLAELSLLFRWFYMQGAARIIAEHPLWGAGPAGFKDAYMIHKPPLSPEEVTSPHSILFDLAATLGIGGVLLAILWLAWVWGLGPALARTNSSYAKHSSHGSESPATFPEQAPASPTDQQTFPFRQEIRALFLIACVPTLIGAYIEAQAATIEGGLVRLAGLIGTTVLAAAIAGALRHRPALVGSLAAGAVALAAHAQIEVTPVTPGAACWFMLLFGSLAAPTADPSPTTGPKAPKVSPTLIAAAPTALILAAVALTLGGLEPTWRWETRLRYAVNAVRVATHFRERLAALDERQPRPDDSLGALAGDLSVALNRPVSADRPEIARALRELQIRQADTAVEDLMDASRVWPTHADTLRAASKLALQIADTVRLHGDPGKALAYADRAEKLALDAAALPRGAAASNAWLGTVRAARAESFNDASALERAVLAWESAARLDPRGLTAPTQLARALAQLGRTEEARAWARRSLELDHSTRLDPLKGLNDEQRTMLKVLAQ